MGARGFPFRRVFQDSAVRSTPTKGTLEFVKDVRQFLERTTGKE